MFVKGDLRSHVRTSFIKPVRYYLSVLDANELKRIRNAAVSVDISAGGLGMLCDFPFEKGHVLTFEEEISTNGITAKAAIVRWAGKVDGNKYRVGLKFI